jgi:hypothetical protein
MMNKISPEIEFPSFKSEQITIDAIFLLFQKVV